MEEQIIKSLISLYAERGMDLSAVVKNPLFAGLPLEKKIETLKKYAGVIASGTSTRFTKDDLKGLLIRASIMGGITGLATLGGIMQTSVPYTHGFMHAAKPIGKAVLVGTAIGTGISAIESLTHRNDRLEIVDRARRLASDPTDDNAIKYIATGGMPSTPNRFLDTIKGFLEIDPKSALKNQMVRGNYEALDSARNHPEQKNIEIDTEDADRIIRKYENLRG